VYDRNQSGSSIPGLTPMVKRIMIATGVVWVLQLLVPGLTDALAVSVPGVFVQGFVWQPVTYMWLHSVQSPMHILLNMFMLWMFGGILERTWGARRFLRFYLITGVGAGVIILIGATLQGVETPTLGASGAIYGIVTAFSLLWPDRTVMLLFPPIPMKAIWFIPVLFFFNYFFSPPNVSQVGHLGGVLVAAILLRKEAGRYFNLPNLRYRWHRYRMRGRLRAVRREEEEKRRRDPPHFH
jgi:membrane associated rhomboid family serine protease